MTVKIKKGYYYYHYYYFIMHGHVLHQLLIIDPRKIHPSILATYPTFKVGGFPSFHKAKDRVYFGLIAEPMQ